MKLLHVVKDGELRLAVSTENGVLDLNRASKELGLSCPVMFKELVLSGDRGLGKIEAILNTSAQQPNLFESEEEIIYGPSVEDPEKIICIGLNYMSHAEESNMDIPKEPVVFSKFSNTLAAHGQEISLPENGEKFDYEAELVLIIGKEARNITKEEAPNYIFGYTIGNDLSVRDWQFKSAQWLLGKTVDDFAPVGPYTVPSKFIGDPHNLDITCEVNGEVRQAANTKDMLFDCYTLVSYLSQHMTLKPGDVIFTGTPEGVIFGYPESERKWLKADDEVSVVIEKLGVLSNKLTQ